MRLAEYDALIQFGRVPDWDARMFGGFSLAALHWMNPEEIQYRIYYSFFLAIISFGPSVLPPFCWYLQRV